VLRVVVGAEGVRVEVLRVRFRSSEEERRAVSRAWRSVAMRWAKGTSSMRRKSRVEAATWGWEDVVSVVCDVVVAMILIVCGSLLWLLSRLVVPVIVWCRCPCSAWIGLIARRCGGRGDLRCSELGISELIAAV